MIEKIMLSGFIASIVWFFAGGALYMNPFIAGIYKKQEKSPALKKWENTKIYLTCMYFIILIQCLLFSGIYMFIKPLFTGTIIFNAIMYGLVLVFIRIIPRLFDMWIQSTYPNILLFIELVNGIIGSFIISLVIAFTI